MKKMLVICLALMMVCTTALAAEWLEGLSPEKPYTGKPEVNFDETIGYMMLYPVKGSTVHAGMDVLSVFLPREDVKAASGTITVYDAQSGEAMEIAVDEASVVARAMTETELDSLLWGSGTVFEVKLPETLEANHDYYVLMSEGWIVSEGYAAVSPAVTADDVWFFNTNVDSAVENMGYFRVIRETAEETMPGEEAAVEVTEEEIPEEEVRVGDKVRFSVAAGEQTASCAIFCNSGSIQPELYTFEGDQENSITFSEAGEVEWGILFLDADGKYVGEIVFTTAVAE